MREPRTETAVVKEVPLPVWPVLVNPCRELASRASGGIEVTLYWNAHDNSTSVEVWQPASEERLLFRVARERALEAFYHPFAHLPTTFDSWIPELDA